MAADRIAAEYRAAILWADDQLQAHRRECEECARMKAQRFPCPMCGRAWRLHQARVKAQDLYDAYKAEQAQRAADQPSLFDVEDLADA